MDILKGEHKRIYDFVPSLKDIDFSNKESNFINLIVDELNIYDSLTTTTKFELARSVEGMRRARFFNPTILGAVLYILRLKNNNNIQPSDFTIANPIIKVVLDKMNIQQENFPIVLSEIFSYTVSIIQFRLQSVTTYDENEDEDEDEEDY